LIEKIKKEELVNLIKPSLMMAKMVKYVHRYLKWKRVVEGISKELEQVKEDPLVEILDPCPEYQYLDIDEFFKIRLAR
jgi:hypothetical protein